MPSCPDCGETHWTQECTSAVDYAIVFDEQRNEWTFGPAEVIEDTETDAYRCACGYYADPELAEQIESALEP